MARHYPALEVRWVGLPADDAIERLVADLDDDHPTAVEVHEDCVRVFFPSIADRDGAQAHLSALAQDLTVSPLEVSDEDWAERSQASLSPVRVGRIVVVPGKDVGCLFPDSSAEKKTPDVILTIIPSMGFGTGHHPSTRLCLRLLQRISLENSAVLDVGTGSGVLALAARKLGADLVVGIDPDPDALRSAEVNLGINGERGAVTLREAGVENASRALRRSFQVVLANLTGGLLCRSAQLLADLTSPRGHLIASGLQQDERHEVLASFQEAGLRLIDEVEEEGWLGLLAQRELRLTNPTHSRTR